MSKHVDYSRVCSYMLLMCVYYAIQIYTFIGFNMCSSLYKITIDSVMMLTCIQTLTKLQSLIAWFIWMVFNANLSPISAMSWCQNYNQYLNFWSYIVIFFVKNYNQDLNGFNLYSSFFKVIIYTLMVYSWIHLFQKEYQI